MDLNYIHMEMDMDTDNDIDNSNFEIQNPQLFLDTQLHLLECITRYILDNKRSDNELPEEFHQDFDERFIERTKEIYLQYYNSSAHYLVVMYSVFFIHLSFFKRYCELGLGNESIVHFSKYFIPYQKKDTSRYFHMIIEIQRNFYNFNPIDDISNMLENMNF